MREATKEDPSSNSIPLLPANILPASELMARAFFEEPFAIYVAPNPTDRARALPLHFATLLRFYQGLNTVYQTRNLEGVCAWEPPCFDQPSNTPSDSIIPPALATELISALGKEAWERYLTIISCMEALRQREMPDPHWYLALLAIDPQHQRKGIGSALLQPLLRQADAENRPAYLWTDQPSSVPFYQCHGFEIMTSMIEPNSGVQFWTLGRKPVKISA